MVPSITGRAIDSDAAVVLREIMVKAQVPHCVITSTIRTAADQARIMYNNCLVHGVAAQKRLYAAAGDEVVQVFADRRNLGRAEVQNLMRAKIIQLHAQGRRVSRHIEMPGDKWWVIDIAPSSIADDKEAAFVAAAKAHPRVVKILTPDNSDPAFHLEISKETARVT